jgi:ATP-dependent RNA helicase RhlE
MEAETLTTSDSVNSFDTLELAPFLKKTIQTIGFTTPTPIQAQAIPLLLAGNDLIGLAQTGTGKTAAFVLPLLHKLSLSETPRATKALILAPTRELAEQINEVIQTFAPRTGIKSTTVYGGVSHSNQIRALRGKPEIVVACPGRLLDHIRGRTVDLSTVECFILDEADRMLDMGFMPDIRNIIEMLPDARQTMLFSATMPKEIESLTHEVLRDPKIVRVKTERPVALVTHSMYSLKDTEKQAMLGSWLSENPDGRVIVFTKMKHTAKRLDEKLGKVGFATTSLHGNLSQAKRAQSLSGFRDGDYRVMIATDIAARGIDVDGITHVVNYDMPDTLDAYIHRSGRAGRAMRTGDAISFVTRADGWIIKQIEKYLGKPMARLTANASFQATPAIEGGENSDEAPRDDSERRGPRGPRGDARRGRGAPRGRAEGGRRGNSARGGRGQFRDREDGGSFRGRGDDRRGPRRSERPDADGAPSAGPSRSFDEAGEPQTAFMGRKSYETGGARSDDSRDRRRGDGARGGRPFRQGGRGPGRPAGFQRSFRGEGSERGERGERPFRGQQDVADTSGRIATSAPRGDRGGSFDRRERSGPEGVRPRFNREGGRPGRFSRPGSERAEGRGGFGSRSRDGGQGENRRGDRRQGEDQSQSRGKRFGRRDDSSSPTEGGRGRGRGKPGGFSRGQGQRGPRRASYD